MAELLSDFLTKPRTKQAMVIGRGLLPVKGKMVLGGAPKTNKSFVVLNMALDLALGKPIFNAFYDVDKPVFPVFRKNRVLYVENEIGEAKLAERFIGITQGCDMTGCDLYIKSRDMEMRMDTLDGRTKIGNEIASIKPDVVFLDPLAGFHVSDENSAQEMGAIMRVGDRWMEDYGCSIVYVHHTGHSDPKFPDHRQGGAKLRGSTAIFAAADAVLILERKSAANCKEPILQLTFDLRHDEALEPMYVKRLSNGVIRYIGESIGEVAVKTAADAPLPRRRFSGEGRYDSI